MARWAPWRRRATECARSAWRLAPAAAFWPWLHAAPAVLAGLGALVLATRGETVPAEKVRTSPGCARLRRAAAARAGFQVENRACGQPQAAEGGATAAQGDALRRGRNRRASVRATHCAPSADVPASRARALARLRAADLRPRAQAVQSQEPRASCSAVAGCRHRGSEEPPAIIWSPAARPGRFPGRRLAGRAGDHARLERGVRSRVVRVPSTEPEGTVVAQNPRERAGTADTVVRLNVSAGRALRHDDGRNDAPRYEEAVPTRRQTSDAQATLKARASVRIADRAAPSPDQEGVVLEQTPAGGQSAPSGSTVTLFVGRLS